MAQDYRNPILFSSISILWLSASRISYKIYPQEFPPRNTTTFKLHPDFTRFPAINGTNFWTIECVIASDSSTIIHTTTHSNAKNIHGSESGPITADIIKAFKWQLQPFLIKQWMLSAPWDPTDLLIGWGTSSVVWESFYSDVKFILHVVV